MILFQAYHNKWGMRVPISREGKTMKYYTAFHSNMNNWGMGIDDYMDNEIDAVWDDNNIKDIPEKGQIHLLKRVFERGEYDLL